MGTRPGDRTRGCARPDGRARHPFATRVRAHHMGRGGSGMLAAPAALTRLTRLTRLLAARWAIGWPLLLPPAALRSRLAVLPRLPILALLPGLAVLP